MGMKKVIAAAVLLLLQTFFVQTEPLPQYAPLFEASFLQGWYCRDWTQEQWQTEYQAMKDAGFHAVILQSAVDLTYEQTDLSLPKTESTAYQLSAAYALYPTALVPDSSNQHALEFALQASKQADMQMYIGTVSDNRWWNYGWGIPDSCFTEWADANAVQCSTVIQEIWTKYGDTYANQIAGFYYNNEIWNMDPACDCSDDGQYAQIIGSNIHASLATINALCPEKPLLISPFYNKDLSTAGEYAAFWRDIADAAQFRSCDIFTHQDGGGRDYDTDTLYEWSDALFSAVGDKMRFWVNNETFNADTSPKSMEQLRQNYLATAQAEKHLLFSWNHYYHGKYDAEFTDFLQSMTGDINADGECTLADAVTLHRWLMHDRITVANWLAGDLDANGVLNAADLTLLKRRIIE